MEEVVLTIKADKDGRLLVTGPLGNKIFCLGMLQMASRIVEDHVPKEEPVEEEDGVKDGVKDGGDVIEINKFIH